MKHRASIHEEAHSNLLVRTLSTSIFAEQVNRVNHQLRPDQDRQCCNSLKPGQTVNKDSMLSLEALWKKPWCVKKENGRPVVVVVVVVVVAAAVVVVVIIIVGTVLLLLFLIIALLLVCLFSFSWLSIDVGIFLQITHHKLWWTFQLWLIIVFKL